MPHSDRERIYLSFHDVVQDVYISRAIWNRIAPMLFAFGTFAALVLASSAAASTASDWLRQTPEEERAKSSGCLSCHAGIEPMHASPSVRLGCVDCHGGDSSIAPQSPASRGSADYEEAKRRAHVAPGLPHEWPSSANPVRSYTLLNDERPEFVRFVNPGDLRVADATCGAVACHPDVVSRVRKSMMATGAMLWSAALYNNGVFPFKDARFGESYSAAGQPQRLYTHPPPSAEQTLARGVLPYLEPLPRFNVAQPGNILRIFERGGRRPLEIANPDPTEEPGRPARRLSERGLGTANRIDPVWLGLQKTRLLDPLLYSLGTNDHPGDYRSSGCTACHVVYANDRDPAHSGALSVHGNRGQTATDDPTIPRGESGHPIRHQLTRSIPSSQCMICHIHPGTSVVNAYYGTMWWDNETDGRHLYPAAPRRLDAERERQIREANPEGAAVRGLWSDPEFLADLWDLNPRLTHTQFADFHGHGWSFRNVYKRDRKGTLLDELDRPVAHDDPQRFDKAVHLQDIHMERGMHCVDCHFEQDAHGDGKLYGENRAATEIECQDCHGSIRSRTSLVTSGNAGGSSLAHLRTPWAKPRFEWRDDQGGRRLYQRSMIDEAVEWRVVQVRDTLTPGDPDYSEAASYAKTVRRDGQTWGDVPTGPLDVAHRESNMACYTCHSAWTTSCFGCHLPLVANRKTDTLHFEGDSTRAWTSYNFQTLREDVFMLGRDGTVKGHRVAPVRSSCAVLVSSQNQNREWVYSQQQTVSAEGFSGQAFSPHFPHTVRSRETRRCSDCHVASANDNNAWLAQVLMLGTGFTNWIGRYVWVGLGPRGFAAVPVTEQDEPQAVIGSTLHQIAYPDRHERHERGGRLLGGALGHHAHDAHSVQLRGEYLYVAQGEEGLVVYDVANVDHKGFSEAVVSAPVSPLGQRLYVKTADASDVASPSTLAIDPTRSRRPENQEGPIHPLYGYLYVADRQEGLIVVDAATLLDGDPMNNFLQRAASYNPDGLLSLSEHLEVAGEHLFMLGPRGLAVISLADPVQPRVVATVGPPALRQPRAIQIQFRYAFALDEDGMKVLDVTDMSAPRLVAALAIAGAREIYVARTYAYVAAGAQGLVIVDVERPEAPRIDQVFDAEGAIDDAHDVEIGMTNASLFAYVADGKNGLRVVQLTSPEHTPGYAGFSPRPMPRLVATWRAPGPAISVSRGIDRDRAVDESGHQLAVFGRRGARPFDAEELRRMYLRHGRVYTVDDRPRKLPVTPAAESGRGRPGRNAPAGAPYSRPPRRPH